MSDGPTCRRKRRLARPARAAGPVRVPFAIVSLFGLPTWSDVDDLIAAKSATIKAIDSAAVATLATWSKSDAAAADAWRTAWKALVARYNEAVKLRPPAAGISLWPFPTDPAPGVTPEVVWGAVLHAIRQAWDPTGPTTQSPPETDGDLSPLANELAAQGAKPDYSSVPQPVVPDADLAMYQAAGVIVQAATGITLNAGPLALIVLLALLARK